MKANKLKQIDIDYREHLQAYLNFTVKAEKKAGKNKTKSVYDNFKKFYDYEKKLEEVMEEKKESKFSKLSKFLKKGG